MVTDEGADFRPHRQFDRRSRAMALDEGIV